LDRTNELIDKNLYKEQLDEHSDSNSNLTIEEIAEIRILRHNFDAKEKKKDKRTKKGHWVHGWNGCSYWITSIYYALCFMQEF